MANCEEKTGLFVLRECRRPTNQQCSCGKQVCNRHSRTDEQGQLWCTTCYLKNKRDRRQLMDEEYERWETGYDPHFALWYYALREDFYHDSSYSPFTEEDYGGFDAESMTEFSDDADGGSFFDS
jgi:hypothetical protein